MIGLVLTLMLVLIAGPAYGGKPRNHEVSGSFSVPGSQRGCTYAQDARRIGAAEPACSDLAEHDIGGQRGAWRDAAGKIVATITLDHGTFERGVFCRCIYRFAARLPDAEFYTLELPPHPPVPFSREDLAGRGWQVNLEF